MDVNTLLTSDGDIKQLRNVIINVQTTLQQAAHDYATAALGASNEALKAVQKDLPAGVVWPHLTDYQALSTKATDALAATMQATGMLLNAEETGDPTIDKMNLNAKIDAVDSHIISAMLEGAAMRVNMVMRCIPKDAKAGQRTDSSALKMKAIDKK